MIHEPGHMMQPMQTPLLRRCIDDWSGGKVKLVGTYHDRQRGFIAVVERREDQARLELPVELHNDYGHIRPKLELFA